MSGVAAIAVIVTRTKEALKKAGANSEETAKTPRELGISKSWLISSSNAGVMATKDGKYYLSHHKKRA